MPKQIGPAHSPHLWNPKSSFLSFLVFLVFYSFSISLFREKGWVHHMCTHIQPVGRFLKIVCCSHAQRTKERKLFSSNLLSLSLLLIFLSLIVFRFRTNSASFSAFNISSLLSFTFSHNFFLFVCFRQT